MSLLYKIILLTCTVTLSTIQLYGQEKINSDQFFEQAFNQLYESELGENKKTKFPWIEALQLRSETRDFDFGQQEYTLRLSPSTRQKIKAQEVLMSHYQNSPDVESSKSLKKIITTLYLDWLSLYFIHEELEMLNGLEVIWNDKKTILQKLIGQYDIDFKDIISLEKDKNELAQIRYELQLEIKSIVSLYNKSSLDFDFDTIINLAEIDAVIKTISEESLTNTSIVDPIYAYKQEELLKEIALEAAEGKQYVDFIQLKYRGPHDDIWQEKYSLGFGFQWPNSGNRKLKLAELKMEQDQLTHEKELEDNESLRETTLSRSKLDFKINKAKNFASLKVEESIELNRISKSIQQKQGYNPMILLDLKENEISNQIKILDYNKDVYEDYIKYLSSLGKLGTMPFTNYLKT